MNAARMRLFGCLLVTACCSSGLTEARTIELNTSRQQTPKWNVHEITKGQLVSAKAVFDGSGIWGHIDSITIPFTNCDGYWRASRHFHIPVGATNLVFHISALGVDDRAVIKLNGVKIASVGTTAKGEGDMQFHDPGENRRYNFMFIAGTVSLTDTTHLKPGRNELKVIVNNTNEGIEGTITPITPNSPSGFGIEATVSFTP